MRALYACTLLAAAAAVALHAPLPPLDLPPPLKTGDASSPSPPELPPLLRSDQPNLEFTIRVDGGKLQITFANGDYLHVKCFNATLDGGLRRIEPATRVAKAKVECAPPQRGYADALRRLGVNLVPGGRLELALPPDGAPFGGDHLTGLSLDRLTLRRRDTQRAPPAPLPDTLQAPALATLSALEVRGVALPPAALKMPPPSLNALVLADSGVQRVPAATLVRLRTLAAAEAEPEGGSETLETLSLTLAEGRAPPDWASFPALTTLSLTSWGEAAPVPWESCLALRSLTVTNAGFASMPEGWLAACTALESLSLHSARLLEALPAGLLAGRCAAPTPAVCVQPALTRLDLRLGRLEKLPDALFDPVPNLRYLDLSRNKLLTLPGGIFTRLIKLETLNLSWNRLADDSVYREFGVLRQLIVLDLSFNPRLGDACLGDGDGRFKSGDSHLSHLTKLTKLILSNTNVTRICRDWRETMTRLLLLRLHNTAITRLSFDDLQYKRDDATLRHSPAPSVELYGSNVTTIEYTAADAVKARERWVPPASVAVRISMPLACDCRLFRAVRALRDNPEHANLGGALHCAGKRIPLSAVPLDELLCEDGNLTALLPPGCVGREREQGEVDKPRWRVRVDCKRANLSAMPALPALDRDIEWDLRLAGNNIVTLDRLPPSLLKLDLRNNSVLEASAEAAAALGGATVALLAGNPLACDCSAAPLLDSLAALRARRALLEDGGVARCGDGRPLLDVAAAARQRCRSTVAPRGVGPAVLGAIGAALGAVALAALAVGSALARPARRARVKGVLLRWGWLPRPPEPADPGRRFDAFVSFAHEDEGFARALIARLETGPRALRLCVHSRDWAPGEYISAQIAASVRSARRTLCVLSRDYVRSGWARAEFREAAAASAREGTPRLVLVLLEEPDALGLDRELRRYLRANTYLRADHPQFWKRLREALPEPRPATAADAPADPPAPAATPPAPAVVARRSAAWRAWLAGVVRAAPTPA